MFLSKRPTTLPTRDKALPGRAEPLPTADKHFVTGEPIKGPYPDGFETAVFAMGCYWGAERRFWQTPGVWVTAVGNAGGITENPTYEEV
ncbi:MAG TPA: peptide-methionine (S)-S-oxide reductase, partial [Hyphomonadaceae bacterium]|nr:peptide-methionine (S)-S-oxide reductase [Hyphomonadaceae bacterium]